MADSANVNDIDWLYPDLMSKEGLVFILEQRYIRQDRSGLESWSKEELVDLYNRYVLPLPQRKYRNNHRGQEMTKKQMLIDKQAKRRNTEDSSDQPKKARTEGQSSGVINHFNIPGMSGTTRLKPPPSAVNFEKKIIKLGSNKPEAGDASNSVKQTERCRLAEKRSYDSSHLENGIQESATDSISGSNKKKIAKITWP